MLAARLEYWAQKFRPVLHDHFKKRCEPMNDKDKLVALIRLRDMLYFGVRPTLRECGFPAQIVQELAKERLIQVGDKRFGDNLDKYFIQAILPAGLSFISERHPLCDRR